MILGASSGDTHIASSIFGIISPSVYSALIKKSGTGLLVNLSIFLRGHRELTNAAICQRSSTVVLSA